MKQNVIITALLLVIGVLVGLGVAYYGMLSDEDAAYFRTLDIQKQRAVLTRLVARMPFSQVLVFLRRAYPKEEPSTHGLGHVVGEVAYLRYREKAFSLCDPIFNYGCYHGVVDEAIRVNGPQKGLAANLWHVCETTMKDPSPCIHAIGHATTELSAYNAQDALSLCDSIFPDPKIGRSCWDGAMMEYMNRTVGTNLVPYGNQNDLYAPCDTLPTKYEASCVRMHLSYLESLGFTYPRLVQFCLTYNNTDTVDGCIDEVGSEASQSYFSDPMKVAALCATTGAYRVSCIFGAVMPFASANNKDAGDMLCKTLPAPGDEAACFARVQGALPNI